MITLQAPDGTRLALHELGGSGSPVLLVPGLGGHAREWSTTAAQLADAHRVFGLDPPGGTATVSATLLMSPGQRTSPTQRQHSKRPVRPS